VYALASISIFTTAVARDKVVEQIVNPLRETALMIEQALAFSNDPIALVDNLDDERVAF